MLGISRPQLVKIETAKAKPSQSTVEGILDAYGQDVDHRRAIMQVVRQIHQRGWWQAYADFLAGSFAELEEDADEILIWQTELVSGLLQTDDYARALISSGDLRDVDEIDERVQARIRRQAVLTGHNAPVLRVVLDESVLRRMIGGPAVMRGQLEHLLEMGQRANVSIRVLPANTGPHAGIGEGSFTIFKFPRPIDLDVTFIETPAGPVYVEDTQRVRRCTVTYDRISDQALSEEDSAALIRAFIEE